MKYLLDTNICIHFLRDDFNIKSKLSSMNYADFALSEITVAELYYGAENSKRVVYHQNLVSHFLSYFTIIPITDILTVFAKEKARLRNNGLKISDFDLLIGSTAIQNSTIMVTENLKDFGQIKGIHIENWVKR